MSNLSEARILEILGTHPAYVKKEEIGGLSARQIGWLSADQIGGLSADQIGWLSARQIGWLSARQIGWLSADGAIKVKAIRSEVPLLKNPYTTILAAINSAGCKLDMGDWHSCKTTHCLAGWTIDKCGVAGYEAEKRFGGTPEAAALILLKSRPEAPLPNFYATNDQAMAFIKARAAEEAK